MTFADFNKDGTLIATGDLKGFIQVWKLESQQQIWEYESSDLEVSLGPQAGQELIYFDFSG